MVGDVDALQNLYLRGLAPPAIALVAGSDGGDRRRDRAASGRAWCWRSACSPPRPWCRCGRRRRTLGARHCRGPRRRSAPRWSSCCGRRPSWWCTAPSSRTLARVEAADDRVAGLSRREGLVAGATDGLARADHRRDGRGGAGGGRVRPRRMAASPGVWVATLGLLALASFESVAALPQAGRELSSTLAAGRRVLELTDRRAAGERTRDGSAAASAARPRLALDAVTAGYADEPAVLRDLSFVARAGPAGRAGGAERRRQDHRGQPAAALPRPARGDGHAGRTRSARVPARGRAHDDGGGGAGLARVCHQHPRERAAGSTRGRRRRDRRGTSAALASTSGWRRCPTVWTRWWARRGAALGWSAPAHHDRPRAARRRAHPGAGRAHRAPRLGHGRGG